MMLVKFPKHPKKAISEILLKKTNKRKIQLYCDSPLPCLLCVSICIVLLVPLV